jgi:hypothetical protein
MGESCEMVTGRWPAGRDRLRFPTSSDLAAFNGGTVSGIAIKQFVNITRSFVTWDIS